MHARKTFAVFSGMAVLLTAMLLPSAVDAGSGGYAPGVDPRPVIAGLQPDRSVTNIVDEVYYTLPNEVPDTLRVLAIRVHFQPDTLSTTFGDGQFMYDYPDTVNPDGWLLDPPPHDKQFFQDHLLAARNYFSKFSNQKLTLAGYKGEDIEGGDVYPHGAQDSYELDYPIWTINYGNDDHQRLNEQLVKLFADSWTLAEENGLADDLAADGRTIDDYDIFIIFHAGSGNEFDTGYDLTPFDIPSVYISENDLQEFGGLTGGVDFAGSKIPNGIILPETQRQLGTDVGMHGTVVAQLGFAIGLPHLYNTETGDAGIGMLGLMDRGFGAFYGTIPIPPSAWSRIFMRWDEPVTVSSFSSIDTVRLGGLHLPDSVFSDNIDDPDNVARLLRIPINDTEYYLAEVRRRDPEEDSLSNGWDRDGRMITFYNDYSWEVEDGFRVAVTYSDYDFDLPSSGVLLWHIDDQLIRNRYADDRIQNNFDKRGIRLQEADGTWDIGKDYPFLTAGDGTELGWADDAFYRDNDSWSDANRPLFNPEFSTNTNPSSISNDGGQTHLTINRFSDIADTMTFRISNGWIQDGFPTEISTILDLSSGDINGDGVNEIIVYGFDSTLNTVFVVDSSGTVIDGFHSSLLSEIFALADLDGDGDDEIISSRRNGLMIANYNPDDDSRDMQQYLNEGEGHIKALVVVDHADGPVVVAVVDEEDDHRTRIFAVRYADNDDQFLFNETFDRNTFETAECFAFAPMAGEDGPDAVIWFKNTQSAWLDLGLAPEVHLVEARVSDATATLVDAVAADFNGDGLTTYMGVLNNNQLVHLTIPEPLFSNTEPFSEILEYPLGTSPSALRVLDMDHDGDLEPAWLNMSSKAIVSVERDGLLAEGTPLQLSRKGGDAHDDKSIIFDSDGDGNFEWFMVTEGDGNSLLLSAYDLSDGTLLPGFPLSLPDESVIGTYSMIAANIDSDDSMELIVATGHANSPDRITAYDLPGFSGEKDVAWGEPDGDPANTRRVSLDLSSVGGVANFTMDDAYCWPNPVLNEDIAHFRYPNRGSEAEVTIYDIAGREQLSKRCTWQGAGMGTDEAEIEVDVSALPSGVYVARLEVGGEVQLIRFAVVN